jgi:hypothetical protein
MLFLVVVAALLCSSPIHAARSITVFYPATLTESTCAGSSSWTKWFNTATPSGNGNTDQEVHPVILAANRRDVCEKPQGMEAQSVSDLSAVNSYQYGWLMMNNIIAGFQSATPGIDYQVRFCCANTDFETTTTTTTTPRPVSSTTCGQAEIKNSFVSRIFGGSTAIRNSWPWVSTYKHFSKKIFFHCFFFKF